MGYNFENCLFHFFFFKHYFQCCRLHNLALDCLTKSYIIASIFYLLNKEVFLHFELSSSRFSNLKNCSIKLKDPFLDAILMTQILLNFSNLLKLRLEVCKSKSFHLVYPDFLVCQTTFKLQSMSKMHKLMLMHE